MSNKAGNSTTNRPFGMKSGKVDRFTHGAKIERSGKTGTFVVTTPAELARLRPVATDATKEFIRLSDRATAGASPAPGPSTR